MRILAGGPAADIEAEYFKASKASIAAQQTGHEITINYIVDPAPDDYVEGEAHTWTEASWLRVGRMRQDFLDMGEAQGYDAVWFVDTDLILGPRTLEYMIDTAAPIAVGVFWTKWPGLDVILPNVWDQHPYNFATDGETVPTLDALTKGSKEALVNGGGACTLIHKEAFGKALYYPPLQGMPDGFWGEDRHFSVRANAHGLDMIATARSRIAHLYSEEQRTPEAIAEAQHITGATP